MATSSFDAARLPYQLGPELRRDWHLQRSLERSLVDSALPALFSIT